MHRWTKNAFWDLNNKKWRKWYKFVSPFLSNDTFGFIVLTKDTKCPNQVFMYDWSIYRLFVLNRCWKQDPLQIKIFVYLCSTWCMVELKTRFDSRITRNVVNGVSLIHLSYLITLMAYLCSQWTPNVQIMYFASDWWMYRLFVLNAGWKRDSPLIMIFVYLCSTWCIDELKTRFETWITRNDVNGVCLFNLSHLITLIAYLCSQNKTDVKIKCTVHGTRNFMFKWSIYRLFVLNSGWKRDSLQLMIFVKVCSTWSIDQLKTRYVTNNKWLEWCKLVLPFLFKNT
jgi:hypothetical protein